MQIDIPNIGEDLNDQHLQLLNATAKSCRHTIIAMLKNSQSGHPGGSLSSIDYLTLLYLFIIGRTGEKVVVSNGHISPAVYSILAELGYADKNEIIDNFRKLGSIYEGHVTRHVKGIEYGTGPLGIGCSVAAAFAHGELMKNSDKNVFAIMGDGEAQEGQVYEMINYARKYELDNLTLFIDFNQVQLTASLNDVMPIDLPAIFKAAKWHVAEVDGHDFSSMWKAIAQARETKGRPSVIIGQTIMGKGVDFMEVEGNNHKSTWHGKAPTPEECDKAMEQLKLTSEETAIIEVIKNIKKWDPPKPDFTESLTPVKINAGTPKLYTLEESTDSRTAYGQALLDLAKHNQNVLAITADLRGSVMTKFVANEVENQHLEVGIAEQHMVSLSGGLSLMDFIPFCSTFGAFMSSRAKDQARVNDINRTNVKMVATHCGLSVGEDGPTHQAIDDMTSFLGMFNTMIIEPADPNQCDRIIRYIASHYGNFYVRMGRHKYPIITNEDGTPFYGTDYNYVYGRSDLIREGNDITLAASGAMVHESMLAWEELKKNHPDLSIELVAVSSIKQFDENLINSIKKTKKIITVEDHNSVSGLSSQLAKHLIQNYIHVDKFESLGVKEYQLSGKSEELYKYAKISSESIKELCLKLLQK